MTSFFLKHKNLYKSFHRFCYIARSSHSELLALVLMSLGFFFSSPATDNKSFDDEDSLDSSILTFCDLASSLVFASYMINMLVLQLYCFVNHTKCPKKAAVFLLARWKVQAKIKSY